MLHLITDETVDRSKEDLEMSTLIEEVLDDYGRLPQTHSTNRLV